MDTITTAQNPARVAARALTGTTYTVLGVDAARSPGARVDQAGPLLAALRKVAPVSLDDETVVRINGAVQAGAGVLLAGGILPRTSALVLIASLVPTTLAGHAFWKEEGKAERKRQRIHFLKNTAMIGGLFFAVLDGPRRAAPVGQLR